VGKNGHAELHGGLRVVGNEKVRRPVLATQDGKAVGLEPPEIIIIDQIVEQFSMASTSGLSWIGELLNGLLSSGFSDDFGLPGPPGSAVWSAGPS